MESADACRRAPPAPARAFLWLVAALAARAALLAADEGFVRLDRVASRAAAQRAERAVAHRLADTVAQEPRALDRDAEHAVELVAADALLGSAQQMDGLEPLVQRDLALLEDRADLDGELLPASGALLRPNQPSRVAFERVGATDHATMGAHRAIRPKHTLDMLVSGLLALEMRGVEKGRGRVACLT